MKKMLSLGIEREAAEDLLNEAYTKYTIKED
jgi:hypothetical protein